MQKIHFAGFHFASLIEERTQIEGPVEKLAPAGSL
jgi:hypothetical protein